MIERLDSHDKHTFNISYGELPYESKQSVPCFVVKTAETVNAVRSSGLTAYWYRTYGGAENETDTAYSGFIPGGIVNLYYPNGVPDVLLPEEVTGGWSLALKGSFKPEYSGDYSFYLGGDGEVTNFSVDSDGDTRTGSDILFKIYDADYSEANAVAATMTADKWYDIALKYRYQGVQDSPAGLACLYVHDDSVEMPDKLVVSAGVTAPLGASNEDGFMPIEIHTVNAVSNVKLNARKDGADVFTFRVPFVSSASTYKWTGFYKRSPYEYFSSSDSIRLKKFDMIEAHEGYWTTAESRIAETVQKFSGQIRDFNIHYSADGSDYLEVICASYEIFLKDSFSLDQPNYMDYITAGYMTAVPGKVNGETRPRAYDGWELRKAYENLLLHAYVDPILTHQKEKRNDYNNEQITGNWFIDQISQTDKVYLANEKDYGRPMVLEDDNDPDAEYNYAISTGEYIFDAINSILEPYGFDWGLNRYGYAYLQGVDSPTKIIHSTTYVDSEDAFVNPNGDDWLVVRDFDCVKACYLHTAENLVSISTNEFNAQRIDAIIKVNPKGHESGIIYSISSAGGQIGGGAIDDSYDTAWAYYKGADPNTGINPCIFRLATNLAYDEYSVGFTSWNTLSCDIDSLFIYDRDINTPVFYFKTSDETNPGQVVTLEVKDTTNDMRNDCIVLGRRTGTKTGIDHEGNPSNINPNNPVLTFHQSRTVDVNSIHSASAVNYAGRPLQTVIVDEQIANQAQADYVSFNFVADHRIASKEVTFRTLGNPLIERNDCIAISEEFKDGLTSTKKMWVTDIQTSFADSYITTFKATDRKPVSSFRVKTEPDLELFDNNPFWNVRVYNGGTNSQIAGDIYDFTTKVWSDSILAYCPPSGYLMFKNDNNDREIVLYNSIGSSEGVWFYDGIKRGLQRTEAIDWDNGDQIIGAYDPYTQDSMSLTPKITFDLVKTGYLQVQINALDGGAVTALTLLTDRSDEDWPIFGQEYVEWGRGIYYTWNGCDDIGAWNKKMVVKNKSLTDDIYVDELKGGVFAIEDISKGYAKLYPKLTLKYSDDNPYVWPKTPNDDPFYFYVRRGIVSTVTFEIDYSAVYTNWDNPTNVYDFYLIDSDVEKDNRYDGEGFSDRRTHDKNDTNNPGFPIYIRTDKSGEGSKVRYTILDSTAKREHLSGDDAFYGNRFYKTFLVANIARYNFVPYTQYQNAELSEKTIVDDQEYHRIFYDAVHNLEGVSGTFSPLDYPETFSYYSEEFFQSIINHMKDHGIEIGTGLTSGMYFLWNNIYFTGNFVDRSGRVAKTTKAYTPDRVIDTSIDEGLYGNQLSAGEYEFEFYYRGNYIGWVDRSLGYGYGTALDPTGRVALYGESIYSWFKNPNLTTILDIYESVSPNVDNPPISSIFSVVMNVARIRGL